MMLYVGMGIGEAMCLHLAPSRICAPWLQCFDHGCTRVSVSTPVNCDPLRQISLVDCLAVVTCMLYTITCSRDLSCCCTACGVVYYTIVPRMLVGFDGWQASSFMVSNFLFLRLITNLEPGWTAGNGESLQACLGVCVWYLCTILAWMPFLNCMHEC